MQVPCSINTHTCCHCCSLKVLIASTLITITMTSNLRSATAELPPLFSLSTLACTHLTVKNIILKQFQQPDNPLRVIVATVAFGMGLDCHNVHHVIHWGLLEGIETYMQEMIGLVGMDYLQQLNYSVPSNTLLHM